MIKIEENINLSKHKKWHEPYYLIFLTNAKASVSINFSSFELPANSLLFLSPYQLLSWENWENQPVFCLKFHGDFYCIEYHKKEVACNGLLFNNIYFQAFVPMENQFFSEIQNIVKKMKNYVDAQDEFSLSILRTYLQLILAIASKEKSELMKKIEPKIKENQELKDFQKLLEKEFIENRSVSFYAEKFGLNASSFSKKIKNLYGISPSVLIRERVVLEAKKMLHLTQNPIKKIALDLSFSDEFYFSRYFKKEVGVSPQQFRDKVGISIVAKKSM
ncbi:Arabinose operon regulatory protein [Candidatus Ornithobacterium hominis]|uniref:helix-turn-helix domain-containing protein n=1 Tax=Candidatus Ornithobacterium hominis TaxID=2497989 RepID=UPI000E5B9856|nr:AraC family transcriptional regulator [Candidatus Ornithobacterium hominis]SZD72837.1 Arabinose operon regulatory protein [Candidatus Ornithobacterium hominis]